MHLQGLAVEACPVTDIAGHVHIRQELHLDAQLALPLAGFAAPAMHIEREASGFVAAHLAFRQLGEQLADLVEHAGISARVGARRAPDGRLVDVDDLVQYARCPRCAHIRPGWVCAPVQAWRQGVVEDIDHQRGFTRSGHPGDADQLAQRDLDVNILQVVGTRPDDGQVFAVAGRRSSRDGHLQRPER